ncbi:MAG: 16S rRNA (guanine(966)-N(2))-methyltransferase RsmD [Oscillospiraceae bacterium]|nr:16S rRNA (guanine(966)-N(2))-methyltransferase RsmD [Oscillospiraceae bacterium]
MRIIAGSRRGCKLTEFEGEDIRPTSDRVKEALFNIISDFVPDARVLDLFAGSGALSLEALSRGAACAVLVDSDKNSIKVIKENTAKTSFEAKAEIINARAGDYIKKCAEKFDLVFLDPPYNKGFIRSSIELLLEYDRLEDGAAVIAETDSVEEEYSFDRLELYRRRRYGRTFITVYIKN